MGFASYLEDINSKIAAIEEIVSEHSKRSHKSDVNKPRELRKQNERTEDVINKLRKEIMNLQTIIQKIKKESAEKGFLLRREQGKADSLSKRVSEQSDLRKAHEKTGLDLSELVIDFTHLFQSMSEITKSNAWHKDRSKIKQLESLIKTGLRRN